MNEHIPVSKYYDIDGLNTIIKDSPKQLLMISVNIVSLPKNVDKIKSLIKKLTKPPSIIHVCETKLPVDEEKLKLLLPEIQIKGYDIVYNNSITNAGGTALYIQENLKFTKREDLTINLPGVECSFIELICENRSKNPLIGTVYRHPSNSPNARLFSVELEELLEKCTNKGTHYSNVSCR